MELARHLVRSAFRTTRRAGAGVILAATTPGERSWARNFWWTLTLCGFTWATISFLPWLYNGVPAFALFALSVVATLRLARVPFSLVKSNRYFAGALLTATALVAVSIWRAQLEALAPDLVKFLLPSPLLTALLAIALIAVAATVAYFLAVRSSRAMRRYGAALARVFACPDDVFSIIARVREKRNGEVVITRLPIIAQVTALTKGSQTEALLAELLPKLAFSPDSDARKRVVLLPVSYEQSLDRETVASSRGLVSHREPQDDLNDRTRRELWTLTEGAGPTSGQTLDAIARDDGRALIAFKPYDHIAYVATLPAETLTIRNRFAEILGVETWQVDVVLEHHDGGIQKIQVRTVKPAGATAAMRVGRFRELAATVPTSASWKVTEDAATGRITMERFEKAVLPTRVAMNHDFYASGSGSWGQISLGADSRGRPVVLNLAEQPHVGVFGATNSGKSIAVQNLLYGALARGFELAIAEPSKFGNDFQWIEPYVRPGGWGCETLAEALETVRGVYNESLRRAQILKQHRHAGKWTDLPPGVLRAERIRPVLLLADEFTALAMSAKAARNLPKESLEFAETTEKADAASLIVYYVAKILAEARYTGIHCVVATQVWSVAQIGDLAGPMRANMGARMLFGTASTIQITQAFTDAGAAEASYTFAHGESPKVLVDGEAPELDDNKTPGRGVIELDGRGYSPVQGAYAPVEEIEAALVNLHIPVTPEELRRPVMVEVSPPVQPQFTSPPVSSVAPPEAVVELGGIDFSLDDLGHSPAPLRPAPAPLAPAPAGAAGDSFAEPVRAAIPTPDLWGD